jgi:hypothetical protein
VQGPEPEHILQSPDFSSNAWVEFSHRSYKWEFVLAAFLGKRLAEEIVYAHLIISGFLAVWRESMLALAIDVLSVPDSKHNHCAFFVLN